MTDTIMSALIALLGIAFNSIYTNWTARKASVEQYRANVISRESIAWISKVRELGNSLLSNIDESASRIPEIINVASEANKDQIREMGIELGDGKRGYSREEGAMLQNISKKYSQAWKAFHIPETQVFKDATALNLYLSSHGYSKSDIVKSLNAVKVKMNDITLLKFEKQDQYTNEMTGLCKGLTELRNTFEKDIASVLEDEWLKLSK